MICVGQVAECCLFFGKYVYVWVVWSSLLSRVGAANGLHYMHSGGVIDNIFWSVDFKVVYQ